MELLLVFSFALILFLVFVQHKELAGRLRLDVGELGFGSFAVVLENIVLAGKCGVEDDAYERTYCETGKGDHESTAGDVYRTGGTVCDADGKNEDESCDDDVSRLGEVDLVLNYVSYTDSGDHAVEYE